jgi:hypothetical protein
MAQDPRFIVMAAVTAAFFAACGDKVTFIECPLGTLPQGSECVPIDPPADTSTSDDVAPNDVAGGEDVVSNDVAGDLAEPTDTASGDTSVAGAAGAACQLNAACRGGTCLDWPTGYCSRIDCRTNDCAGDGICVDIAAGNSACLATCNSDADCRTPHQACKTLVDGDGLVKVCMGIAPEATGIGSGCADPAKCTGSSACIAGFPGGYCAPLGCTAATCPPDSTCVTVEGRPACLRACFNDDDCGSREGAERKCGVLAAVDGSPAQVCISGISGRDNGASCISDFECTSGLCQILGEGRCNVSGVPCFQSSSSATCGVGDYCRITANSRVGVCGQVCSTGIGCNNNSFCVSEGTDARSTWCRPSCLSNPSVCNAEVGLACRYGLPLGDSGQGRYVCAAAVLGSAFFSCNGDAACPGGRCLKAASGNSGYCTRACGDDDFCDFGGTCVRGAQGDQCYRMCFDNSDCPSGFGCGPVSGSQRWVCAPN